MAKGNDNDMFNDLLKEARKGVEQEAKQLATETARREQVERDAREREESMKREEAQRRLIEENRRRNEALARRDRDGDRKPDRKSASTAKHARVAAEVEGPVAATEVAAAPKRPSRLLLAGFVAGGLAVGVGTGFALQPESKGSFPDVDMAARTVVAQTSRAAAAEKKLGDQLGQVQADLDTLNKQLGGAGSDVQKLRTELAQYRADLTKAQEELAKEREKTPGKKVTPPGPGEPGMPKFDDCTFGDCKKKTP